MPPIGTIIGILGGWRAAGFAVIVLVLGAMLAWDRAVTIPRLHARAADAELRAAEAETETIRAVTAAQRDAAELKRLTDDAEAAKSRADKARKDAEARARAVANQLDALRKELADAKAEDDGPVSPSLARVFDGLRRAP